MITAHITGDKMAELPGVIEDLTTKRLPRSPPRRGHVARVASCGKVLQMQGQAAAEAAEAAAAAVAVSGGQCQSCTERGRRALANAPAAAGTAPPPRLPRPRAPRPCLRARSGARAGSRGRRRAEHRGGRHGRWRRGRTGARRGTAGRGLSRASSRQVGRPGRGGGEGAGAVGLGLG